MKDNVQIMSILKNQGFYLNKQGDQGNSPLSISIKKRKINLALHLYNIFEMEIINNITEIVLKKFNNMLIYRSAKAISSYTKL